CSILTGTAVHRLLHSFPTRRSSDLVSHMISELKMAISKQETEHSGAKNGGGFWGTREEAKKSSKTLRRINGRRRIREELRYGERSEEHTSELQSRFELVCRLLLEKK